MKKEVEMGYIKVVEQSAIGEWLDAHRTGIGASEIAAVLGAHRFNSRLRVWAEKVGRLEPRDLSDNEAVQMGIELEPFVASLYQKKTQRVVDKAGTLLRSILHPWAICTPDYWLMDDDGQWNIPLQIKTTNAFRLNEWAEGPPDEVWWQVQHEMLVTGAPWASVGVLVGGQRFMWADVVRDEAAIARIIAEGKAFWEMVVEHRYPEPDANSADVLTELFPDSAEGEELALPHEAVEWDGELVQLKAQRSTLDDQIQDLENHIKLAIGEAERGVLHDGSGAYTYKNQERWSYKPISRATHHGEIVQAIANRSEFRVLRRSTRA